MPRSRPRADPTQVRRKPTGYRSSEAQLSAIRKLSDYAFESACSTYPNNPPHSPDPRRINEHHHS
jgi:hypothetical protein